MYYSLIDGPATLFEAMLLLIAFIWCLIYFCSKRAQQRKEEEEERKKKQVYIVPIKRASGERIRVPMTLDEIYQKGVDYLRGDGVEQNEAKAIKWLRSAAKLGHQEASLMLKIYEQKSS